MKISSITLGLLASTAIARTTLVASGDPCKDKYNACKAPKDPKTAVGANGKKLNPDQLELKCGCAWAACLGEDNARSREHCAKVEKNHWIDPDAKPKPVPKPAPKPAPPPPAGPCQDKYKQCKHPKDPKVALDPHGKKYNDQQLEHKCGCALQSCLGEDNARGRDHCAKLKKNNWVDTDAGKKPRPKHRRSANERLSFQGKNNQWTWKNGRWHQE